jgi:hypothetical protein
LSAAKGIAALILVLPLLGAAGDPSEKVRQKIDTTLSKEPTVSARADALCRLAWTDDDPDVREFARMKIVQYGKFGIPALRRAVRWAPKEQQPDVVKALLEAWEHVEIGIPKDYLPALEEATWFGGHDSRMLAIPELGRFSYRPALLTIIDAGWEDVSLQPAVVSALQNLRDDRARFFLEHTMLEGGPGVREASAVALATIGGRCLLPLKAAIRSDDAALRLIAIRALLPVATTDDLSVLHEYVYEHPDDDESTVRAVRDSAAALEKVLAAQEGADAASPMPD